MQPNLPPPQQNPAAANLLNTPNLEPVPDTNQVMTQEQWANDQHELNQLMHQLSETHRHESNIPRLMSDGLIDPSEEAGHRQDLANQRAGIFQRIAGLSANSDSSQIIGILETQAGIAGGNRQAANDRVAEAHTAAGKARLTGTVAEVKYHDTTRGYAADPTTDTDTLKGRAKEVNIYNAAAARDTGKARLADEERANSITSRAKSHGFEQSLTHIADSLRQQHENSRVQIEAVVNDATQELSDWDIRGGEAYPGQEQVIRQRLQELDQQLGGLSQFDTLRAQAQGEYVRLRYRLESRGIIRDAVSGAPSSDRQHLPNGGIRINANTNAEVIIYPNGVSARPDGNGGFDHRMPSGREWQPTEEAADAVRPIDEDDLYLQEARARVARANPGMNPDDQERRALQQAAFNRWEENRTPATAAVAHERLGEFLERQDQREAQLGGHLQRITGEIAGYQQAITDAQNQYQTAAAEASRLNALGNLNPDQQQQWQDAMDAMTTAQAAEQTAIQEANANIPRLQQDQARVEAGIQRTRETSNPYRYWRAFMEVNPNPHNHPAAVQARWMMGHTVRTQGNPPVQPRLLSDGSLLLNNAEINGIRDPQWRIWPDGVTSRQTPQGPQYFRPNGTPQ